MLPAREYRIKPRKRHWVALRLRSSGLYPVSLLGREYSLATNWSLCWERFEGRSKCGELVWTQAFGSDLGGEIDDTWDRPLDEGIGVVTAMWMGDRRAQNISIGSAALWAINQQDLRYLEVERGKWRGRKSVDWFTVTLDIGALYIVKEWT
jgi:hypothetical protein